MQLTVLFNHNMLIISLEISPLLQGQWVKVFENNCPLVPAGTATEYKCLQIV